MGIDPNLEGPCSKPAGLLHKLLKDFLRRCDAYQREHICKDCVCDTDAFLALKNELLSDMDEGAAEKRQKTTELQLMVDAVKQEAQTSTPVKAGKLSQQSIVVSVHSCQAYVIRVVQRSALPLVNTVFSPPPGVYFEYVYTPTQVSLDWGRAPIARGKVFSSRVFVETMVFFVPFLMWPLDLSTT